MRSGHALINGTTTLNSNLLFTSDSVSVHNRARLASNGGELAAVVEHDGFSGPGLGFALLNPAGTVIDEFGSLGGNFNGVIATDGANFFVAGSRYVSPNRQFHHLQITSADVRSHVVAREDMPGSLQYLNGARSNGSTAVVYTDTSGATPSLQLMRASGDALQGPIQLAQGAQMGDVTALTNGDFAVAWASATGLGMQIRKTNGTTVVCSGQAEFGNGALDQMDSVAIAQSSLGILVLAADYGSEVGRVDLFVFDETCQLRSEAADELYYVNPNYDSHDYELPYLPRIAVGEGYVALGWTATYSNKAGSYISYVRVLPEAMCEEE